MNCDSKIVRQKLTEAELDNNQGVWVTFKFVNTCHHTSHTLRTCNMLVLPTPEAPKNAALRGPCSHGGSAPPSRVMRYAEMHLFCMWISIAIEIFVDCVLLLLVALMVVVLVVLAMLLLLLVAVVVVFFVAAAVDAFAVGVVIDVAVR